MLLRRVWRRQSIKSNATYYLVLSVMKKNKAEWRGKESVNVLVYMRLSGDISANI